jgi:hypothetical protein
LLASEEPPDHVGVRHLFFRAPWFLVLVLVSGLWLWACVSCLVCIVYIREYRETRKSISRELPMCVFPLCVGVGGGGSSASLGGGGVRRHFRGQISDCRCLLKYCVCDPFPVYGVAARAGWTQHVGGPVRAVASCEGQKKNRKKTADVRTYLFGLGFF